MNVTLEVVDKVTKKVTDKTQSAAAIADMLNTPEFDNPVKQQQVPQPFDFSSLAALIGPTSLHGLVNYVHFDIVIQDVRKQDRDAVALWAKALAAGGYITVDEAGALIGAVSATVPDPTWKPMLSWAEVNLGDTLTVLDVTDCAKYGKW